MHYCRDPHSCWKPRLPARGKRDKRIRHQKLHVDDEMGREEAEEAEAVLVNCYMEIGKDDALGHPGMRVRSLACPDGIPARVCKTCWAENS